MAASAAVRAAPIAGAGVAICAAIASASRPLSRTMAIAPRPGAVAQATIVSSALLCIHQFTATDFIRSAHYMAGTGDGGRGTEDGGRGAEDGGRGTGFLSQ